ncbi:galactosyldiacylglycerol synthase [Mesobacillus campisalis]|uniref:Galactosyldiacylglycerol synthase n=1 Tax=Mesobacillus campisalis TaxID=1408103 RepID=A0A0M2SYA4_9BACI|nr:glycosyltransferase [Mesobacillus campisalis]KKK39153.1 galactosyldiacylglycerol synthase [Mesobacillus campisalis]
MTKKILIISSEHTGHGHKSITEALSEKIRAYRHAEIHVVDGFSLGGRALEKIGKAYGPITRRAESVWNVIWNLSAMAPSIVDHLVEALIEERFLALIKELQPDIILSVHPNFVGSVLNIMEKKKLQIPFVILIADLVNIYPLWVDKRADFIISPTMEAKQLCLEKYGIPPSQIGVFGLPVRSRFYPKTGSKKTEPLPTAPLNCLVMGGGEGAGNMKKIAKNLLDHFDCNVRIVAGRNEKLKSNLELSLKKRYGDRVHIYGFTENIHQLMLHSDLIFTRASPNVMYEAVASNTPLVITGALPGQEADNPKFAENNHLGIICRNPDDIKDSLSDLLVNDGERLRQIIQSQRTFSNQKAADDILKFILNQEVAHYETEAEFRLLIEK